MTLVVALRGDGFVVLGADRRGTVLGDDGSVAHNIFEKLIEVNDHVALLLHGNGPPMTFLLEEFQKTPGLSRMGVSSATRALATVCRREWDEIPLTSRPLIKSYGFVVGGLDRKPKGRWSARCLGLNSARGFCFDSYVPFGIFGKPMIANYLFARHYRSTISEVRALWLVALSLLETRTVDGDVGGNVHLAIVRPSGCSHFDDDDAIDMVERAPLDGPD
jgi:20S proteasome alpha/beta subunit